MLLPSALSHLLTLAAQGRGSCVVSLTVHTKCPLFLCSKHLQFLGEELHCLLETLALSHRHLGHTEKHNAKSAGSRDTDVWCRHPGNISRIIGRIELKTVWASEGDGVSEGEQNAYLAGDTMSTKTMSSG